MSAQVTAEGPVVITGAAGFIGRALVKRLGSMARPFTHEELDIHDEKAVRRQLETLRPWAVINAAAEADVDRCESNPVQAWRTNGVAPGILARNAAAVHTRFIHLSTDYVFGGDKERRYAPDDDTGPVNRYGATKVEGERRVRDEHPEAKICRVAWVYGHGGRGFGSQLPFRLARGESVEAISDRFGHPTYVRDIADRVVELLLCDRPGIYHVVNGGPTSWFEFARRMADRLGLGEDALRPVSRLDLPARDAVRPIHLALEVTGGDTVGIAPLRPWQEAQDAFVRELIGFAESAK